MYDLPEHLKKNTSVRKPVGWGADFFRAPEGRYTEDRGTTRRKKREERIDKKTIVFGGI